MPNVYGVVGTFIGQETKGKVAAWTAFSTGAELSIRFGGCNGSHYVQTARGLSHSFTHFSSASFYGVSTVLAQMVLEPKMLFDEAQVLEDLGIGRNMLSRIQIHQGCIAITPFHIAISRIREMVREAMNAKKGTVGLGVGEAVLDSRRDPRLTIRAADFANKNVLWDKVKAIQLQKQQEASLLLAGFDECANLPDGLVPNLEMLHNDHLAEAAVYWLCALGSEVKIINDQQLIELIKSTQRIVVEGSHGTLLHPYYGFAPHTTQLDPTGARLLQLFSKVLTRNDRLVWLGALRSYAHRHGAGPLVSQDDAFGDSVDPERSLDDDGWLGPLRIGPFDLVAARYGIDCVGGPVHYTGLSISHLDDMRGREIWPMCVGYYFDGKLPNDLEDYFELEGDQIVSIKVHPNTQDEAHLQHQLRLTKLLNQCKPVVSYVTSGEDQSLEEAFLNRVEQELGVPVVMTGDGPTVENHHHVRPGWEHLFV